MMIFVGFAGQKEIIMGVMKSIAIDKMNEANRTILSNIPIYVHVSEAIYVNNEKRKKALISALNQYDISEESIC